MRCCFFHRQFPDRRISPSILKKLMKQAGIKMKKIKVFNAPQRKSLRLEEFDDKIVALDEQVSNIIK